MSSSISLRRVTSSIASWRRELTEVRRLTADGESYRRLAADLLFYRVLRFYPRGGESSTRSISVRPERTLNYRLNRGDIWTVNEVWMQQAYRLPESLTIRSVIDLGANIGLTSLWFATHYDLDYALLVEPSPRNALLAEKNMRQVSAPHQIVRAAVGPFNGSAVFRETVSSVLGSVDFEARQCAEASSNEHAPPPHRETRQDARYSDEYSVPVVSMDSLLSRLPAGQTVDLVKLDIEGGELELFGGDLGWLARVRALIAELHPPRVDPQDIVNKMLSRGFKHSPFGDVHLFVRR